MSHVQWLSGFKADLEKLGAFCRERGIFTLIDGTQFIGTGPIDLAALQVDAYGASGYKWLLAGFGNGFLYTAPHFFNELDIRIGGFDFKCYSFDRCDLGDGNCNCYQRNIDDMACRNGFDIFTEEQNV